VLNMESWSGDGIEQEQCGRQVILH